MTASKSTKTTKTTSARGRRPAKPEPIGTTSAGLARLNDEDAIAWIAANRTEGQTVGALHRAFRAAGYGANLKRFARLAAEA